MNHLQMFRTISHRVKNAAVATAFVATQLLAPVLASGVVHAAAIPTNKVGFSSVGFVLSGSYSSVNGQPTGSGQLKNGNVGGYPEGACIPAEFVVTNNDNTAGDTLVSPIFDYYDNGVVGITNYEKVTTSLSGDPAASADNLNDFTFSGQPLSAATSFPTSAGGTVNATVTGAFSGDTAGTSATTSTDAFRHYNIALSNVPAKTSVYMLLCARLSLDAAQYPGSSLSLRTVQGGAENVPIPVNQILALPSLTISKSVAAGTASPSDFSFDVSPSINGVSHYAIAQGQSSVTIDNVSPDGNYTVTESGPAGYTFTGGTGTNCTANQATVGTAAGAMTASVAAGTLGQNSTLKNATCNFTNSVQKGSITISKDAIPDSATTFDFTASGTGVSGFTLDGDSDPTVPSTKTFSDLLPGDYTFTEASTTGWDFDGISCSQGSDVSKTDTSVTVHLTAGQSVSCEYTNRQRGQIIVHKVTDPGNDPTNFTVTASGTSSVTGATAISGTATRTDLSTTNDVVYDVAQGTYSIAESTASGWAEDDSDCANLTVNGNTPLVNGVPTVSCTITNTKLAKLTIVKQTNPASSSQSFSFTPSANLSGSNFTLDTDGNTATPNSQVFANLTPGQTYSVTENTQSGWQLTGLTCTSGYTWNGTGSTVTLTSGAGDDITCTYTNTQLGSISGTKFNVNADETHVGTVAGVTINLCDDNNVCLTTKTDTGGNYSFSDLLPKNYSIVEVLTAGSGWTQIFSPSDVNLTAGQTSTGNDFGNFQNATISGYKWNDRNGDGTKQSDEPKLADWTMDLYLKVNGVDVFQRSDVTDATGQYQFDGLAPGTYKVCEEMQNGWVQTYPTTSDRCHHFTVKLSGQTLGGNFGNQGQGTITVSKDLDDGFGHVTNDVSGWTWNYDGTYGTANSQTASTTNHVTVPAGTYSLTENGQKDYHFGSLVCDGVDQQGSTGSVTVTPGSNVSCVYTNVRDTGTLVVKKNVINDNGGTKTYQDFSFQVNNGTAQQFDADASDQTGQDGTKTLTVVTGTYDVTEPQANSMGYSTSYDTCSDAVVSAGQATTCTITNDDVAPTLALVKIVNNDHGGKATPANFQGEVSGTNVTWGAANTETAGVAYTLSEETLAGGAGYRASDWSCTGGGTQNGDQITLGLAENVTCTITNSDIAPTLTLKKVVVNDNGGSATANQWTLTARPTNSVTSLINEQGTLNNDGSASTSTQQAMANQAYDLSESGGPSGYAASDWSCTDGVLNGSQLTLDLAENVTCTITNNDVAPTLTVFKFVNNQDTNLTKTAADFTMNVSGTNVSTSSFPGSENGVTVTLNAGAYAVSENTDSNYTADYEGDCQGTISVGQSLMCYVTNTAVRQPAIHVEKSGPATAHAGDTVTYTFTVTNPGNVPLGALTVSDDVAGNGATLQSGDTSNIGWLDPGETWVYTINYKIPANQTASVVNTVMACGTEGVLEDVDIAPEKVCDTDTHTTRILSQGHVLGASTVKPQLVNTGDDALFSIIAALTMMGLALATRWAGRSRTTA